jgi:hypothetical protein
MGCTRGTGTYILNNICRILWENILEDVQVEDGEEGIIIGKIIQ